MVDLLTETAHCSFLWLLARARFGRRSISHLGSEWCGESGQAWTLSE